MPAKSDDTGPAMGEDALLGILTHAMDAIIVLDEGQKITLFNHAAEKMFGHTADTLIGQPLDQLIPEPFRRDHGIRVEAFGKTGATLRSPNHLGVISGLRADGREFPVEASIARIEIGGKIIFSIILRDVSERSRMEAELLAQKNQYAMVSQTSHAITHATDQTDLLNSICRIAVEHGNFKFAWVGLLNAEKDAFVPVTVCGDDAGMIEQQKYLPKDIAQQLHAVRLAAFDRSGYVLRNDLIADPETSAWRHLAENAGVQSFAGFPLKIKGEAAGMIAMYAGQAGYFTEKLIPALQAMAADVAYAVENLQNSETLRQTVEHNKLLAEIVRGMDETCFALDKNWRFTFVNDHGTSLLRHSREEMLGNSIWDVFHQLLGTPMEKQYRRAMAERVPVSFEAFSPIAQCWLDIRLFPSGEGVAAFLMDISARKQSQELMRQSEELFRQVVENIEEVFWMTDPAKNTMLYISPAYEKVWGRKVQDLYDSPSEWLAAIHPEDRERVTRALAYQLQGVYNEEYRIVRPDGSERWISDRSFLVRDDAGNVQRIVGVAEDITERRRLATELSRFVALSPVVLYALRIERDRIVSTWRSQNLNQITGHNAGEGTDTWWVENIHPEDLQRVLAAHKLPYEIDHQVLEYRFRKADGKYIWLRDEKRLVRDAAGHPAEIIGSWSDASEKIQLEMQMRQAQKMEAIGQLSAGIAHDFNNLLTVIQGNSAMLGIEAVAEMRKVFIHEIDTATAKAASLVRQLLLVGRKQSLELRQLDLNETAKQTLSMLRRIVGDDIDLRIQTAAEPLLVRADGGMIDQILLNLAVNSRDAMPKGGSLLIDLSAKSFEQNTAELMQEVKPGDYACIAVSDTGTGIPKEIQSHIFEPFFTTKDIGKGTGLGLATVFGIAQQHGGWVNLYSEPGEGTVFRVYLPRIEKKPAEKQENPVAVKPRGGKETILVVEDEASIRRIVATILTRLGYRVLEAATGKEALEVWKAHHNEIQLLITDVIMPDGMNGVELVRILSQSTPNLRVIFTSGYTADLVHSEYKIEEGLNFIAKPYSLDALAAVVRNCLEKNPQG